MPGVSNCTRDAAIEDSSYEGTEKAFMAANPGSVEHAVAKPLDGEKRAKFIEQLKPQPAFTSATAIRVASWMCCKTRSF